MHERPGRKVDPNLLLGLDTPDDAAVYRLDEETALVQTVDFFTPVVDDPYDWGAIAVANALSDIYAMGARPITGLNLVAWPKELDMDLLARVLEGGADKADEASTAVVGGHSIDDQEPKYGMAVTGLAHPARIMRVASAQPEMSLVLTKPLGMGIISTAIKRGEASPATAAAATRLMSTLNAAAAEAMVAAGAGACTDVTGFGLIGHLHNMAGSSGVSVEIIASRVPLVEGVLGLAEKGLVPGGTRRNESHYGQWTVFEDGVAEPLRLALFDAQTSGGLLIAISPENQPRLMDELAARSVEGTLIGSFSDGEAGRISVKAGP